MGKVTAESRYLGCILGLAIGDALGYPIEFQNHGPFAVSDLASPALYSDDTQMSIATAVGIIAGGTTDAVHRAYLSWLRTQDDQRQRRAPGRTCIEALTSGKIGSIHRHINNSKGCGGIMRVAPAGLVFEPGAAFGKGADYAAITHGHPSGYLSAGFLAELISHIVESEPLDQALDSSTNSLAAFDGHKETLRAVENARRLAARAGFVASDIAELGGGAVGEQALAIAVYSALRFSDDFSKGVLASVNHGGDSDSTGSICGAILGTMLGVEAIPPRWVEQIENSRGLKELALRLAGVERKA